MSSSHLDHFADKGNDAEEDLSEYLLTKRGATNEDIALADTQGERVVGVARGDYDSGQKASVCLYGREKVLADGSISQGDKLVASGSTDGRAIAAKNASTGDKVVGHALQDASSGKWFWAVVYPEKDHRPVREVSATVGSESSDTITISYAQELSRADQVLVELMEDAGSDTGLQLVADASGTGQDLSVGANGTADTTGTSKRLLASFDANGDLDVDVNDNSGSLSADRYVRLIPQDGRGTSLMTKVTFS